MNGERPVPARSNMSHAATIGGGFESGRRTYERYQATDRGGVHAAQASDPASGARTHARLCSEMLVGARSPSRTFVAVRQRPGPRVRCRGALRLDLHPAHFNGPTTCHAGLGGRLTQVVVCGQ